MKLKERMAKHYNRRHLKGDEGFTLIELLVVILIIAILAAVGIVALLSALNSGRKSAATTVLRNGITAVRSWQTGQGQTDYTGISDTVMGTAEPDITWVATGTEATAGGNSISITLSSGIVYMASKSEKNVCYFTRLDPNPSGSNKSTMYASATSGTCTGTNSAAVASWSATTKAGWSN